MLEELIETGKTVEAAIESACEKLGCDRDSCEWEIIDLPKKGGFLGLKNLPAKVRVSIERPDPKPVAQKPAPEQRPAQKPAPDKKPQAKPAPEQRARPEPKLVHEKKSAAAVPAPQPVISMDPPSEELGQKAEATKAYLKSVLEAMLTEPVNIDSHWEDGGVYFAIKGDGLGVIIGRRGDTLDSLQYLCGLVANRMDGDYLRVTVDCGDYRVKRKETLEALAHKLSEQVLRTNTAKTLEPMNPFERRIIHSTVSTIEGVTSTSVGEEPNRRVIITSPTAKNPRRGGRSGGRGRDDRPREGGRSGGGRHRSGGSSRDDRPREDRRGRGPGRDRGERKPSLEVTPSAPPAKPPTEAENKPLYGKIEID